MLTEEQIASYRRDGFLHVPGVIAGEELRRLVAVTDRVQAEAVAYGRELDARGAIELQDDHGFAEWDELDDRKFLYARGADGERVWRRAEGMWDRDPMFRITTAHPGLLEAVAQVLEAEALPSNDSMVAKMPGAGAAVPWHRDPPGDLALKEGRDASYDFTCDIYLDPSTLDNGCLWAIPGSHRGGGEDLDPMDFDVPGAVPLEAAAGDVVFHSTGVLHGSPPNMSDATRRTFYVHYRSIEELQRGYWAKPDPWFDEQRAFLERIQEERRDAGLSNG